MEKNRFSKPVAFNRTKASDQQILKYVSRKNFNFSGYVKKLILADLKQKGIENTKKVETKKEETASEKMERMKAELKRKSSDSVSD